MKKIAKRLFPVFLCCVTLFLSSCSLLPEIKTTAEITFEQLSGKTVQGIALNDKYLLIMALDYEENPLEYEEEILETDFNYYFYVWNIAFGRLKSEFTVNSDVCDDFAEISLTDNNEIKVLSYNNKEKSKIYDFNFNEIGNAGECAADKDAKAYEKAEASGLVDPKRYAITNNLAYTSNYIDKTLNVFLNDDKNIYIAEKNNDAILNCIDKKVYCYNQEEDSGLIQYYCADYENRTSSEISLNYDINYSPSYLAVGNKYSALALNNDENGQINKITIINNSAMEQHSLENVEKISADEIDSKIKSLESSIKSDFGIDIETYREYDENSVINDYTYNNDNLKSELLLTLYDLKHCLSTFPKEMYSEIIKNDRAENIYDKLKIYIVGNFEETDGRSVNAFCKTFLSEDDSVEDEIIIVYSVSVFNISTFYHEFMHAFEYRIGYYESNYNDEWMALNPDGFEYTYGDPDMNPYYDNEEIQSYFANDYGTTNSLEDRATVFERMCVSAYENETEPYWLRADYKNLFTKAKFIYRIIKESFPSLSDENFYVWEAYKDILQ